MKKQDKLLVAEFLGTTEGKKLLMVFAEKWGNTGDIINALNYTASVAKRDNCLEAFQIAFAIDMGKIFTPIVAEILKVAVISIKKSKK